MGNRRAAESLLQQLVTLGPDRTVVKLDVKQYFSSINHEIALSMISEVLVDSSLDPLLSSLFSSHKEYKKSGRGIPIGNVSSQYIANLFLTPLDRCGEEEKDVYYIRYMNDIVLAGARKDKVYALAQSLVELAESA